MKTMENIYSDNSGGAVTNTDLRRPERYKVGRRWLPDGSKRSRTDPHAIGRVILHDMLTCRLGHIVLMCMIMRHRLHDNFTDVALSMSCGRF